MKKPTSFKLFVLLMGMAFSFSLQAEQSQTLILNFEKVTSLALKNSTQIQLAKTDHQIAVENLRQSKAVYDLNLSGNFYHQVDESDKNSIAFGSKTETTLYGISLAQTIPLGSTLSVGYNSTRVKAENINPLFANFNPYYDSQIALSLSQPLLKNSFGYATRKNLQSVKEAVNANGFLTASRIDLALYQIYLHYYQYIFSLENKLLSIKALGRANKLVSTNQEKLDLSIIESADLSAYQANLENRKSDVYAIEQLVVQYETQLKEDLGIDIKEPIQVEYKINPKKENLVYDALLSTALAKRADYLALNKDLEALNLNLKSYQNQKLPTLNAKGSLIYNGIDGSHNSSLGEIEGENRIWEIGLEFSHPLQNRNARAIVNKQKLQIKRKEIEIEALTREIKAQIEYAMNQLNAQKKKYQSYLKAENFEKEKVDGEKIRFDQGRSDSDILIRYENDFILAQRNTLQAKVDYQLARLNLDFVMGILRTK